MAINFINDEYVLGFRLDMSISRRIFHDGGQWKEQYTRNEIIGTTLQKCHERITRGYRYPLLGQSLDHIVPFRAADVECPEQTKLRRMHLMHYTNLQAISRDANAEKAHALLPLEELPDDLDEKVLRIYHEAVYRYGNDPDFWSRVHDKESLAKKASEKFQKKYGLTEYQVQRMVTRRKVQSKPSNDLK